ncbi:hypothetical protein MKW92_035020, partial [Papaver armeniacum]
MENHNRSEFIKAFCDDFTELFWATWNSSHQDSSTPSFDDKIGGVAIDSQVETDIEELESMTKDNYDLMGAEVLDSTATTNCSHGSGESELKMNESEIDVEFKSISLDSVDLSSVRESIQNSSTPRATYE